MKNIDLKLIEKLAENMNTNSLTEISLKMGDQKLILKKEKSCKEVVTTQIQSRPVKKKEKQIEKQDNTKEKLSGNIITSPMMGTFYRSPSPGVNYFVEEGQCVEKGETVCIIEAMKMMNEVTSDFSGKVIRVLVEDGTVVKKGDNLFVIE